MRHIAIGLIFAALPLCALDTRGFHDNQEREMRCDEQGTVRDSSRYRTCDIREQTIGTNGALHVNGGPNGGIAVKGWSGKNVLVRSKVEAWADSDGEAKSISSAVQVQANTGDVRSTGPVEHDQRGWSVSYEVFVPYLTDLNANTTNGGVHLSDIGGTIQVQTTNGGLHLTRLAGDVHGETTNGGVSVNLIGDHWDGNGLEVSSTNGGVSIEVPSSYSAHLEGSTVNGGVHNDFGGAVKSLGLGLRMQSVDATVGSGGATVKATTVNGGVSFRRS